MRVTGEVYTHGPHPQKRNEIVQRNAALQRSIPNALTSKPDHDQTSPEKLKARE